MPYSQVEETILDTLIMQ